MVSKAIAVQEGPKASIHTKTQVPQIDSPGAGETLETRTGRSLAQGGKKNSSSRASDAFPGYGILWFSKEGRAKGFEVALGEHQGQRP